MSSYRILIVTNRAPYPFKDGGNLAMRAMIDGYHKEGWDVQLLSMNTVRHPVQEADLKNAYKDIKVHSIQIDNRLRLWATLRNFLFSRQPNHVDRFFHAHFATKLEQVIKEFKPDVLQFESIYLAAYLPGIRHYSKAVAVLRLHNIEYQVWQRLARQVSNPLKRFYLGNLAQRIKRFELKAWQQADLLVPITETDADVVKSSGIKTPVQVAPFGIDTAQVSLVNRKEEWIVYHIGAMDWQPNAASIQWFLTDVWPFIHKLFPGLKFYFAGRNMPQHFKDVHIANVICAGEVTDADVFIADKKILIVPLKSGGGIRVKILEAMAKGKVIISTAVGMQGIDAIPGKHYLLAETAEEFTKAISWCLEHKDEAEAMGMVAAGLVIKDYDAAHIMKNLTARVVNLIPMHK